jgi:hypothetical protein
VRLAEVSPPTKPVKLGVIVGTVPPTVIVPDDAVIRSGAGVTLSVPLT